MSSTTSTARAATCRAESHWPNHDDVIGMPPGGVSPAADLQRQLAEAALRNFFTSTTAASAQARRWGARRRVVALITVAVGSWAAVFSLGAALVR